jgi:hypothetical protein
MCLISLALIDYPTAFHLPPEPSSFLYSPQAIATTRVDFQRHPITRSYISSRALANFELLPQLLEGYALFALPNQHSAEQTHQRLAQRITLPQSIRHSFLEISAELFFAISLFLVQWSLQYKLQDRHRQTEHLSSALLAARQLADSHGVLHAVGAFGWPIVTL